MIPLNDTEANRYIRFPYMVMALIVGNVFMLGVEIWLSLQGEAAFVNFIFRFGGIPAVTLARAGGGGVTALSHMFLHGGIFHLFGNMLALWVYGRRVEDACGPWRFLAFYLSCGVFAEIVYTLARAESTIPGIGASGAIFGVMGGYLLLYPGGRIRTLVMVSFVPIFPRIRAFWIILYFFGLQIVPAVRTLLGSGRYQVAHWAHLGGFIGALTLFFFLRPEVFHRYRNGMAL